MKNMHKKLIIVVTLLLGSLTYMAQAARIMVHNLTSYEVFLEQQTSRGGVRICTVMAGESSRYGDFKLGPIAIKIKKSILKPTLVEEENTLAISDDGVMLNEILISEHSKL